LQERAAKVEAGIRGHASVEADLETLALLLEAMTTRLDQALPQEPVSAPAPAPDATTQAEAGEILLKLRSLLEESDSEAEELLVEHMGLVRTLLAGRTEQFAHLVSNFDFDKALAMLPARV